SRLPLPRLLLFLLLLFPASLLLRGDPGGSLAMTRGLTEDEETVEDSINEDEDVEAEVEDDEPTYLAQDKEEEDVSGEPEASPSADTTILFVKGEARGWKALWSGLNYKDLDGNIFQDAVCYQTVTIIETEDGLDVETIFGYMFLTGLGLFVVVGLHQLLESRKSSQNDVDMSWIPQETLNQINKASSRRLPRRQKGASLVVVGSG
uniref:Translocon-associated protein subunit alpha n=1 Tax=Monodon monoceros TaxID=40151 RepID=A0A8C6AJN3_MONMO